VSIDELETAGRDRDDAGVPGTARNVEIKAAVKDFVRVTAALTALSAGAPARPTQEDTFFRTPRGRLKLRKLGPASGELIYYQRPDVAGPKPSAYALVKTVEPDQLRDVLAAAYGIVGVVRKHRTVRLVGRTRVHLDDVEGLGRFVELEVVLGEAEPVEPGVTEAHHLMATLGIQPDQLVSRAYIDLLLDARGRTR
jgi:predicted adenylyl cyclase CyaB